MQEGLANAKEKQERAGAGTPDIALRSHALYINARRSANRRNRNSRYWSGLGPFHKAIHTYPSPIRADVFRKGGAMRILLFCAVISLVALSAATATRQPEDEDSCRFKISESTTKPTISGPEDIVAMTYLIE
jgi:hypothetical protein